MFVKPDPLAEFEGNVKTFMPTEQELRMVTNRNKECLYYWIGKLLFLNIQKNLNFLLR